MHVWIVKQGAYYQDMTFVVSVHTTKAGAVSKCHKDGFKFDKSQGFFCNEKERLYRKMWRQPVIEKENMDDRKRVWEVRKEKLYKEIN